MRDEKGAVALLAILALITLVGLIGYSMQRTSGLSAVTGGLYKGSEEASYVADAGIQHVTWNLSKGIPILGLVSKPFGRGTYTVTSMIHPDGTLGITSTGVVGGSQVIVRRRVGQPTDIISVFNILDTYIYRWDPSKNYSTLTNLIPKKDQHVLLNIDLSEIPPGVTIQSAVLSLYLYNYNKDDTARMYTIKEAWVDSQATWSNRKTSTPWTKPGENWNSNPRWDIATKSNGWKTVDVTARVQSWVNGTTPNYGFIIQNNNASDYFYSSDYTMDPSLVPILTVTWKY